MTDAPGSDNPKAIFRNSDAAPFIYFDNVAASGTMAGAIEIELAARTLSPIPDGGISIEFVPVAHLRCSPAAAIHLRNSLNSAIKIYEDFQGEPSVSAGKLN
jgi:hypothetical protein